MKILITGGTGFIGTNLIPLLKDHEVVLIDNLSHSIYNKDYHKNAKFYFCDILDEIKLNEIFKIELPNIVFHFAGLVSIYDCHKDPKFAALNNIIGTINVFNAALNNNCDRVIFAETSAVYENCDLPINGYNEDQSDPITFYAATKASLLLLAKSYSITKGLKFTALRYFNVVGAIQDYKRTVPPLFAGVALRLIGGNNPIIFGDGSRRRDFIHVDDINAFHLKCLNDERTINQVFNLGTSDHKSLFEICEIIHKYLNINKELDYDFYDEINGEAHTIFANISKAKNIGWYPIKSIYESIYDTVNYLKKEINNGNIDPKNFMTNLEIKNIKIK